jgi:hypothetical protein
MGMLFNSQGTLAVLGVLNGRYQALNAGNRADATAYTGKTAGAYTNPTLVDVWTALGFTTGTPAYDDNFKTWLKAIETLPHGGTTSANALREAIARFLTATVIRAGVVTFVYNSIEFFAVPSKQIMVQFPPPVETTLSTGAVTVSAVITVETVTYDKAGAYVSSLKKRPRGS